MSTTTEATEVEEPSAHGAWRAVLLFALVLSGACTPTVTRVQDGAVVTGPPIAPEAYASYLQGRLLELEGRRGEAEAKYVATTQLDSRAHEAWIRIGAMRCGTHPADALRAFENAEELAPRSVALWQERALCALSTRSPVTALLASARAFALAPNDPRSGHLRILAQLQGRRLDEARIATWAHVARFPRDSLGWRLLASLYEGSLRVSLLSQAAVRTRTVNEQHQTPLDASLRQLLKVLHLPELGNQAARSHAECTLMDALYREDGAAAAKASQQLGLSTLRLATVALERGAYEQVFTEARRAASIAPDNQEAWSLALTSAELLGRDEAFAELLQAPPRPSGDTSPTVTRWLLTLLARRIPGSEAAPTEAQTLHRNSIAPHPGGAATEQAH